MSVRGDIGGEEQENDNRSGEGKKRQRQDEVRTQHHSDREDVVKESKAKLASSREKQKPQGKTGLRRKPLFTASACRRVKNHTVEERDAEMGK